MKVKWIEFDSLGFSTAKSAYPEEANPDDFITSHEGEVIDTFTSWWTRYFLINENDNIVKVRAEDCKIIK